MVNITINQLSVSVPDGSTILDAARFAGVHIPHLCYLREVNEIGACRLCSVEVEGEEKLASACNNVVREGMKILTNSPRVRRAVRTNLELILSQHNCKCALCVRSGNCQLQQLANDYNIKTTYYEEDIPTGQQVRWSRSFPVVRDNTKCVKCMRCIQICDKIQTLGIWDLAGTGSRTHIDVSQNRLIAESDCAQCGQCITHCPVGALYERSATDAVMQVLEDPDIVTVFQIAPAVRTALGEEQGLQPEIATVNRLAGALRQMGADYVFDTSFTADLTIMEEGTEFLKRLQRGDMKEYPMFTSCCPGWVRFVKSQFPELVPQLSSAKSPQQMFGALIKSVFAERIGVAPENIRCISIMPCTAKKGEAELPTMKSAAGTPDVDYVLTTREIMRMLRAEQVDLQKVWESAFDHIFGEYTGAGVIFGATGGVMEAALRTAAFLVTGQKPAPEAFRAVRAGGEVGEHPWQEAEYDLNGTTLRVAAVSGLGNARALCEAVRDHRVHYDFVEVMACPGGCSGGGGQPIHCDDEERGLSRGRTLYSLDRGMPVRFSHENPDVQALYQSFLGNPLSEKSEQLLHTDHSAWKMPGEN